MIRDQGSDGHRQRQSSDDVVQGAGGAIEGGLSRGVMNVVFGHCGEVCPVSAILPWKYQMSGSEFGFEGWVMY